MPSKEKAAKFPEIPPPIKNNFSITVASVNGTGSQTANTVLLRALFRMGIPVSGKNIFPSNIQGLPTWFSIRLNAEGFCGRCERPEILVAMNKATLEEDLQNVLTGGVFLFADNLAIDHPREDVTSIAIPAALLARESGADARLRPYVANMVYVGVLAWLLGIEMHEIEAGLDYFFDGKLAAVELNKKVIHAAWDWAKDHIAPSPAYRVERMGNSDGMILIDGNTAAALGAIWGGVTFEAWYPITPATTLSEALQEQLPRLRKDPETTHNTFAVVQAEDELAALGMAVGAGWMGARSMTATSGPGLSLMAEYIDFAYFAEIPVVIWDVQRLGPSTGLPTRTSQGDLIFSYFMGHGDGRHVVLLPAAEECFEFGWLAFDIAERLQTPVLVLSDLDIGMNMWRVPAFRFPDRPMDRGKVLTPAQVEKLPEYARYRDVEGDGIGWRTLPGNTSPKAAYYMRGTGHDELTGYSENPEVWERNMARLRRKFETAHGIVPHPILETRRGSKVGFIAFGSVDSPLQETRRHLFNRGVANDYLRLRALPFTKGVRDFLMAHETIYVVEMNSDGQLSSLLQMEFPDAAAKIQSLAHSDGLPFTAEWITNAVLEHRGLAK